MAEKLSTSQNNPLSDKDSNPRPDFKQASQNLIYQSVMRAGGVPFLAPFEIGLSSLTERVVKFFKQKSFFGFETIERAKKSRAFNKFTRYGAARFRGRYRNGR